MNRSARRSFGLLLLWLVLACAVIVLAALSANQYVLVALAWFGGVVSNLLYQDFRRAR